MYTDLELFSLKIQEKYLPKVFEFFLKSTATSKIFPFKTETYLPCDSFVCMCNPLTTFFFENERIENTNFFLIFFYFNSSFR